MTGRNVGIIVLIDSQPFGRGSFLQNSVTKAILAKCKNLVIWIV